jgi:hypothetical protein
VVQNSRTQHQETDAQETFEMSLNNKNRQQIKESESAKVASTTLNDKTKSKSLDSKQQSSPTSSTSLIQELMIQLLPSQHLPSEDLLPADISEREDLNYTSFQFDTDEHLMLSVLYIQQDCPAIMKSKSDFICAMSQAFDKAQTVDNFHGM